MLISPYSYLSILSLDECETNHLNAVDQVTQIDCAFKILTEILAFSYHRHYHSLQRLPVRYHCQHL